MPKLSFTSENMPTPEEFQRMLAEAMAESNPVDELLELAHELQQYDLASDEFYIRFERGELGDATEFVEWSATYEMIQNLEDRLTVLGGEKADEQ